MVCGVYEPLSFGRLGRQIEGECFIAIRIALSYLVVVILDSVLPYVVFSKKAARLLGNGELVAGLEDSRSSVFS